MTAARALLALGLACLAPAAAGAGAGRGACLHVPGGGVIAFEGDSITYGQEDPGGGGAPINGAPQKRSVSPFPESFEKALDGRVFVINRGFPGDRLRDGVERWAFDPAGDVTFILFGGNDALNYGRRPGGVVPVADFERELGAYLRSPRFAGRRTVLLTEPPFAPEMDAKVAPYREAVRRVGRATRRPVIDTAAFLRGDAAPWTDGVHLTPAAYRAIGDGLASSICVDRTRAATAPR